MKGSKQPHQLSPSQYIRTRARKLPIDSCYINESWKESGLASIIVARRNSNQNLTFGIYLVDLFALGTKDAFYKFNVPEEDVLEVIKDRDDEKFIKTDYTLVHNIIYGANAFAEDHGFVVCKEFELTQYVLEEDTEDIELMDIEFGKNGKPFLIS
jgi:hypothetical protein